MRHVNGIRVIRSRGLLDIIESSLLQCVDWILAGCAGRVENIGGNRRLPDSLGDHDLDFLATTLAAAIADIRRVGGDDIAFLHGIAILFRHLIFDIGNLEQTLVVAPLHIGDGACCGRVACHTIRLGHGPIAAGALIVPPCPTAGATCKQQRHHACDDERRATLFRGFAVWSIAGFVALRDGGLRCSAVDGIVKAIDDAVCRQRETCRRFWIDVLLLHRHDGCRVRLDPVQLACAIIELLRRRCRGSGRNRIADIGWRTVICGCGTVGSADVYRGKTILPIADRKRRSQTLQLG